VAGAAPRPKPPAAAARAPLATRVDPLEQAARLLGSGDADAAEALLRERLDTQPADGAAWFLLGEALVARNETSQARAAFATAAGCKGLDPTLAAAARRRAGG
jgi:cytochrome c-type biogenesis protein CcmH/NrfG